MKITVESPQGDTSSFNVYELDTHIICAELGKMAKDAEEQIKSLEQIPTSKISLVAIRNYKIRKSFAEQMIKSIQEV